MLAQRVTDALRGKWFRTYGYVCCVAHDDKRPSLRLRDGDKDGKLLVRCEAGCEPREILSELRRRGLLADDEPAGNHPQDEERSRQIHESAERTRRRNEERALEIWRASVRATGTPAELYLRRRGIVKPIPPSLRYHVGLRHPDTGAVFPAMVAGVQDQARRIRGIHRTFITADGLKAPVADQKLSLGPIAGGAIRLCAAAPELAIGEGIETALSFMQATDLATWAALSTSGMCSIVLPPLPLAATVYLCVDLDENHAGEKAAARAAERLVAEGRAVKLAMPLAGKDMNDALQELVVHAR